MSTTHSLDDLKSYHTEAMQFFGAELTLLTDAIPNITEDRLAKAAVLLISAGQTGAALFELAKQIDTFSSQTVMLARAFMETVTNFCYVGVCDEKEYRAFILHPIYKQYHNIASPRMEDDIDFFGDNTTTDTVISKIKENYQSRKEKQDRLKMIPIVQEALALFSESKGHLNWTKKSLNERIDVIQKWGKLLDVFFTINKIQYYADASETLHGSLYGCTYNVGTFDPDFDHTIEGELEKKILKDNTCILLHLGMLIHESFTLISYTNDIQKIWDYSYKNRNQALKFLYHVLEIKLRKLNIKKQ